MQLVQSLLFALSLSCSVLSAPTRPQRQGRSFKVDRVLQGASNGPESLNRACRKFGIGKVNLGVDMKLGSGQDEDQTGDVTATSVQGDAQFVSQVTIGGQPIVMNFDTGSADLYVLKKKTKKKKEKALERGMR